MREQTIVVYEMNGKPPRIEHGVLPRLHVKTPLGFKMVKWR